jgi:hypothetical protein
MQNPHVVLAVDGDAGDLAQRPVVGQVVGPQGGDGITGGVLGPSHGRSRHHSEDGDEHCGNTRIFHRHFSLIARSFEHATVHATLSIAADAIFFGPKMDRCITPPRRICTCSAGGS